MERGAREEDSGSGAAPDEPGRYGGYAAESARPDPLADLLAGFEEPAGAAASGSDEGARDEGSGRGASPGDTGGEPVAGEAGVAEAPSAGEGGHDALGALAAATTEARPAAGPTTPAGVRSVPVAEPDAVPDGDGADWQSVAEQRIDALTELIRSAKGRAMSSGQCIVNRADVLTRLDDVRSLLPTELGAAAAVLREKNRIVSTARAESQAQLAEAQARADALVAEATERADALMRDGLAEQERLVSAAAVTAVAARQAEFMVNDATRRAERRRQETDEYVDARLAAFEALLQKTLTQVLRGRERMQEEMAAYRSDDLADASPAVDPDGWDSQPVDGSTYSAGRG